MQRIFQPNGAPRGFGQQRGQSLYLDQPGVNTSGSMPLQRERYEEQRDEPRQNPGQAMMALAGQPNSDEQRISNAMQALVGARPRMKPPKQQPSMGGGDEQPAQASAIQAALMASPEAHRSAGEAAGQDMSWMDEPGAVAAPRSTWQRGEIVGSAREGADFSRLGGGFSDADTDSMKHAFGRIAQNFDVSDAGLQALVQDEEFRRLFPNARLDKDWIDFGGQIDPHTGEAIGRIDAQAGWQAGGRGRNWQWLPEEYLLAEQAQQRSAAQSAPMMTTDNAAPMMNALLGGQPNAGADLGALLQMLLSGQSPT